MNSSTQRGSAPVEFVMVAPLVLLVFCAVLQIGLAGYVRTTLVSAAAEGARAGAEAGATDIDAQRRTKAAVANSVAADVVEEVSVAHITESGVPMVAVTIQAHLPLFGLIGPNAMMVSAHAIREDVG